MAEIKFQNIWKRYPDGFEAVKDIFSFAIWGVRGGARAVELSGHGIRA